MATQLQSKFETFHRANPDVYRQFATISYELWQSDIRQYAANSLLAVIRFNHALLHRNTSLKIDASFGTRYAEMLAKEDARFSEFFKKK